MTNSPGGDSPAAIERDLPGWHIWRSRGSDGQPSSWAASRRADNAGVDLTVVRNTAREMRAALAEQRDLVERTGVRPLEVEVFPLETFPLDDDDEQNS